MGEAKQQTKRPPWIVDLPSDDPDGKRSFTIACRGSVALGEALHYFTLAASYEVADGKANKSDKTISVKRMGDTIAKYLGVSKKTAIDYTRTLAEWKFLILHSYQHSYEVCHHAVEDAIKNPPEKEYPKPRGKHVKREDCKSTNSKSSNVPAQKRAKRVELLEGQIVNLQTQIVDLQTKMLNLQTQMFNLQSSQFHQGASEAGADAQNSPYLLLSITNDITTDYFSDAANADITGTPSALSSGFTEEPEERDHPDLQSLEGENADGDMAHPRLAPQSGWSAVFSSSCVHATGMESGRVETETKSDEASATLQTSAQTQTVTDSYSQPGSEIGTPPVSLSEQNTAIPITSGQRQGEVSAADETEYHSQFDSVENVPEWAQGATNGTGIDNDYSAVSSHPGGTNRDGARASRVASRDGQPGAVQHATGGNHTARSVAARSEVDDGSMGTGCGRDTGTLSDPARSNGGHQSRAGAREPEAAHDQRSSALGESAQSAGHCEPADLLRRNAGGQRGAGRAGTVKDEAVGTDKGNKGAGRKAKKDHPLSPEERERWRKWKKIIMDNRGGELQDQGKIINEAEEIKKVLARFNDAQLHTIWWYMTTQHFKWSKPDFKHTIGGYALNHEANGIKKTLEELRKWPEDSVPGKPLSPDTWETTPPLVRSGTGYQNMNAKMAAMAKQFALVPRGE